MNVVREQIKSVKQVLSIQEVDSAKTYRPAAFCMLTEVDGQDIAYNTLTGEIAELTEKEAGLLREKEIAFCEEASELVKKWYLVPVEHDDIQLSDEIEAFVKLFEKEDGISSYTIFPTMDCNARCFYCFENGRQKMPMSEQTAKDVVEYICKNAPSDKKVKIAWFGGEPLYNARVIDIITSGLKEKGIEFASTIVSNGFLFNDELVSHAKNDWNLKQAQITLDGEEETYNTVKAYIDADGKNPFLVVTDNIEKLVLADIKVNIRLNMGEHNKEELFSLVEWLGKRFAGEKKPNVYAHLLFEYEKTGVSVEKHIAAAKALSMLEQRCFELGFSHVEPVRKEVRLNHCMADSDRAITILPTGKLGKCEHYSDDEFVGDIYSGITDKAKVAEFAERVVPKELCNDCPAYPQCIRLKKCNTNVLAPCDVARRMLAKHKLEIQAKYTYRKLKEKETKAE